MRILMLNYEFPPLGGGASPVSYEIAKGYVKLGHKVDVVTMGFKGLPKFEVKDGIKIYRVKCLRSKKEICHPHEMLSYIIAAKSFLKKHLKSNSYDINHTHFIIPTGILAYWIKQNFGLEYIISSHGSDVPGYNPDRFKFLHYFSANVIKKILRNSKVIIVPTMYFSNFMIRRGIFKGKKKIKVINYPFNPKHIASKKYNKKNIILASGRLLERKGFHRLVDAFQSLNLKDWKLVLIGDGPYKSKLEKIISKKPENIVLTGWLNNVSVKYKKLFNSAKIFVLMSENETQGVVIQEAMASKCAIITSDAGGCAETVGKFGIKQDPHNIPLLSSNLKKLINNPQLMIKIGKDLQSLVKKKYNPLKIYNTYSRLINSVTEIRKQ